MDIGKLAAAIVIAYKTLEAEEKNEVVTPDVAAEAMQQPMELAAVPFEESEPDVEPLVGNEHLLQKNYPGNTEAPPVRVVKQVIAAQPDRVSLQDFYHNVNSELVDQGYAQMLQRGIRHYAYKMGYKRDQGLVNGLRCNILVRESKR